MSDLNQAIAKFSGREIDLYIAALTKFDFVKFRASRGCPWEASYISTANTPWADIIVRMPDGKERWIERERIIRCCCQCGCTDNAACADGCAWADIKTCTTCIRKGRT